MTTMFKAAVIAVAISSGATAATIKVDVTVTDPGNIGFSGPSFRFYNLSDTGFQISSVGINSPFPIDYVLNTSGFYAVSDPSGGTRTLTLGEESTGTDFNNGCTPGVGYNLTSFDPGDFFNFAVDPESPSCGSAVVDVRSFLDADLVGITVGFSNGVTLSGSDWTFELIDPQGGMGNDNQRYRLSLLQEISDEVPEPATLGLFGLAALGLGLRRRTR